MFSACVVLHLFSDVQYIVVNGLGVRLFLKFSVHVRYLSCDIPLYHIYFPNLLLSFALLVPAVCAKIEQKVLH